MKLIGNRYHGDPEIYGVDNPQMEYTEATVGPTAQIHVLDWMHLQVEGGFAFYRNFEFLNGDQTAASYDLEPAGYMRARLVFGM